VEGLVQSRRGDEGLGLEWVATGCKGVGVLVWNGWGWAGGGMCEGVGWCGVGWGGGGKGGWVEEGRAAKTQNGNPAKVCGSPAGQATAIVLPIPVKGPTRMPSSPLVALTL
jgi:hypothetical protein